MKTEILVPTIWDSSIIIHEIKTAVKERIYDWHIHRECEFYMLIDGEKIFWVDNKKYVLQKGDIIFVNERIPHKTQSFENACGFLMQMGTDFTLNFEGKTSFRHISHFGKEVEVFRANTEINLELTACLKEIIKESNEKNNSYEMYIKALVYKVFAILCRHNILREHKLNSKEVERILPVLNYIEENYSRHVVLSDMAKLLYMDKSHFCRIFKKATGLSFMDYLNYVRICNAENLLVRTNKRISEIAEETGFSSASYFTEMFKRYLQYPPGYYRKSKEMTIEL